MLYVHASLMASAFLLSLTGFISARFLRSKRWWLRLHRTLGIIGTICLIAGAVAAIVMISRLGEGHFDVPHTWLGLATILVGISALTIGYLQFKVPSAIVKLRMWHHRLGYTTIIFLPLTVLSGLFAAGVL